MTRAFAVLALAALAASLSGCWQISAIYQQQEIDQLQRERRAADSIAAITRWRADSAAQHVADSLMFARYRADSIR